MSERPPSVPREAVWDDFEDEVRADPEFAAWLESIRTDTMTVDGAWEVLGERGERLPEIAAVLRTAPRNDGSEDDENEGDDLDDEDEDDFDEDDEDFEDTDSGESCWNTAWPLVEVLGDRLSPELSRWLDVAETLPRTYRGSYQPALTSTVDDAVQAEDGRWVARFQALFLPVATVLIEEEELTHATWAATPRGTSLVYYAHQDEPGCWLRDRSLAGFLATQGLRDAKDEDIVLPAVTRERWDRAVDLVDGEPQPDWPPCLSVEHLYPRTGWLVELLLGVDARHDLADAPGLDVWQAEREQAAAWPHLQAYWLLHHLIFDNREELPYLVACAEHRYPPVDELVAVAETVLGGGEPGVGWWDAAAVRALRLAAADGHARVLSPAARERAGVAVARRDDAVAEASDARAALATDPASGEVFALWDLLESAAGSLESYETTLADKLVSGDETLSYVMRHHLGETSILLRLLVRLAGMVGPPYRPFFEAAVRRGAGYGEEHAAAVPGALVGLGVATGDFAAFRTHVEELLGADRLGRRRRAELAVVAAVQFGQPAAREYLVAEATRFAGQLADGAWRYETVSYPLFRLLDLEPATGGRILAGALSAATFTGANWTPAIRLIEYAAEHRVAEAAPGILAALDGELGRHDDGERAIVASAYATCAGAAGRRDEAVAALTARLESIHDVRAGCERCGLLAGLLTAAPDDAGAHAQARDAIDALLAGHLEGMAIGAAVSLLRAVHAAGAPGFGDLAERVLARTTGGSDANDSLVAWLREAAPGMREADAGSMADGGSTTDGGEG